MRKTPMNRGKGIQRKGKIKPRKYGKEPTVDGAPLRDLKDELDRLIRTIIALRDERCFTCPTREGLQVGHLFRRGIERTRWNLLNNNAQCPSCNSIHETNPEIYVGCFVQRFGEDAYTNLREESQRRGRLTYVELLSLRDSLRRQVVRSAK